MPGGIDSLVPQLRGAFMSRNDMTAWLNAITEEFAASSIDSTKWTTTATSTGVQAVIATDSPTRINMETGCGIDSVSDILYGAGPRWNASDKLTVLVRARFAASTEGTAEPSANAFFFPIMLQSTSQSSRVWLGYDSAINATCFVLFTNDGSAINGAQGSINTIKEIDTSWHDFELTIRNGSVHARIDCDPTPFAENTSHITNADLRFRSGVTNRTGMSVRGEIDSVTLLPRLIVF